MKKLKKFILITGASSGIGEISAELLAQKGFHVFAGVRKSEDVEKLKSKALNITPVIIDVTSEDTINGAFAKISEITEGFGLSGLVNNAGIAVAGPMEFLPLDKLRYQMEVNVIGQVAVIQKFLPLLRKGQGRIVNISSVAGLASFPLNGAYSASKFAFEAVSDALRRELSLWGIPVSIIEPGVIKTPIWEKSVSLVEETIKNMPPQAEKYYGKFYQGAVEKMRKKVDEKGAKPEEVAEKILQALTAKNPKTRYLVGKDAFILSMIINLPDKWLDKLICKKLEPNKQLNVNKF